MFGSLLPTKPQEGEEDIEETDAPAPGKEVEKEGEVRESMADILLAKNNLSSLQKQVYSYNNYSLTHAISFMCYNMYIRSMKFLELVYVCNK